MNSLLPRALCFLAALSTAMAAESTGSKREDPSEKLPWTAGPSTGDLKGRAQIKVPEGFRYLDAANAAKWLVMHGNQSNKRELGMLQNVKDKWAVIFEFEDSGYVKDDEKDKISGMADKILADIKEGNEQGNEYRKQNGMPPIKVLGWHVTPRYNDQTKNLEWSILGESTGEKFVNYNVRVLGRKGVTEIVLLEDFETVDKTLPAFRDLIKDFSYKKDESYAEYKPGDKVAQYGLAALVAGGAAAVAYKVGFFGLIAAFFKKGWKLIVLAVAGIGAWLKRLFGGRSNE